ncbi:MAG: flagellar basal body rod protein FlgC [Alphaproteobacteria bacterium]|nr:flagellar basal body rod protein FlgC [Alphaproteobacteria bacterium]
MDDLLVSSKLAVAGLKAQAKRLRVISENLANADSVASTPGGMPYQRKVVTFQNVLDKEIGVETVKAGKVIKDKSEFAKEYNPSHPAAGSDGYVMLPNVNPLIEMMDMKEAQRSYEANLRTVEASRNMMKNTIGLLKN